MGLSRSLPGGLFRHAGFHKLLNVQVAKATLRKRNIAPLEKGNDMLSTAAVASNYNDLPELDEADRYLKGAGSDAILTELLGVIVKHDMGKYVGIRLLHKHNVISEDEIMVEYHSLEEDGFSLITKATKESDIHRSYVPNSWQYRDGGFVPIEFSESFLVSDSDINPGKYAAFFAELGDAIKRTGAAEVLGPSLLGSDFIERHRPEGHSILAEMTAQDDRANVLRFAKPEPVLSDKSVQTHWCVSSSDPTGVVTMTCTKICPSVQNPPVHQGTYIHKQS